MTRWRAFTVVLLLISTVFFTTGYNHIELVNQLCSTDYMKDILWPGMELPQQKRGLAECLQRPALGFNHYLWLFVVGCLAVALGITATVVAYALWFKKRWSKLALSSLLVASIIYVLLFWMKESTVVIASVAAIVLMTLYICVRKFLPKDA